MGARQSCSKTCDKCAADCARPINGSLDDFDDERPGGDPAGATFEETLEDLSSLDRHLMLFCGTSNLSAVRWLLHLGANWDASDANGTTCLHVGCRAGVMSIVKELMQYAALLEATDNAGWTSLHVAVLMGRREVVVRLLQAGAPVHKRNAKGQLPAELCADNGTFEALRSFELHSKEAPGKPWQFSKDLGPGEDITSNRLQYEPFFVPRQPIIRSQQYKKEFQRIGTAMFNRQPGYGLAFLVASGVTRDYPVDMSTFMRRSKVNIGMVGGFLGEAFSLSHTIRLEFINSVALQDTGVVSALTRVFHMLQLPDDLQKINRLVHGVARIWWRQHERMVKDLSGGIKAPQKKHVAIDPPQAAGELIGLDLKQYLSSSDVLHQLMFTTVMLHWYIHRDGTGVRNEMDFAGWKRLNRSIEAGHNDVPEHVQRRVHHVICQAFIGELAIASAGRSRDAAGGGPDEGGGHGPGDEANVVPSERSRSSVLSPGVSAEGWGQIVGGGFPKPSGLSGVQTVTYRHMSNIFSEVTGSLGPERSPLGASLEGPGIIGGGSGGPVPAPGIDMAGLHGSRRDDVAWLSLCYTLLFFSASYASGAPYAFVELQKVCLHNVQPEARILTLAGALDDDVGGGPEEPPSMRQPAASARASGGPGAPGGEPAKACAPVAIVLLLPDGRWQELSLPKLDLRIPTTAELDMWTTHLSAASQGKMLKPPSLVPRPNG